MSDNLSSLEKLSQVLGWPSPLILLLMIAFALAVLAGFSWAIIRRVKKQAPPSIVQEKKEAARLPVETKSHVVVEPKIPAPKAGPERARTAKIEPTVTLSKPPEEPLIKSDSAKIATAPVPPAPVAASLVKPSSQPTPVEAKKKAVKPVAALPKAQPEPAPKLLVTKPDKEAKPAEAPALITPPEPPSNKKALKAALSSTRGGFMAKLSRLFSRSPEINDDDFEEMESILFTADIGAKTAQKLLDALRERVRSEKKSSKEFLQAALKEEMRTILRSVSSAELKPAASPSVLMFVGVNGAGKTTSIGKLGAQLSATGKKIFFGAGDTFRAAAVKQLSIWGERSGITVVTGKENADSASVLFEAIVEAKKANADMVLCDTAGRLHTKIELMEELKKVYRVVNKAQPGAPHEIFLVIDATMGQNALVQAREFAEAAPLTGVILSKLDGTAKGGIALGIVDELGVPIRYIGIGEQSSDLRPFDADEFIDALFLESEA